MTIAITALLDICLLQRQLDFSLMTPSICHRSSTGRPQLLCAVCNVQAAILVKVFHEEHPINDCPEIHAGVWMKLGGRKRFTGYKEFGGASSCTQAGLEAFLVDIPWKSFFRGTQAHIPAIVLAAVFKLDMWDIQRAMQTIYKVR